MLDLKGHAISVVLNSHRLSGTSGENTNEKLGQFLTSDKKQHNSIMNHLRKMGIDKYNQSELEKANPNIQRERRPAKHSANNTVSCTKCLGVYQRQCYN